MRNRARWEPTDSDARDLNQTLKSEELAMGWTGDPKDNDKKLQYTCPQEGFTTFGPLSRVRRSDEV